MNKKVLTKDELRVNRSIERLISRCVSKMDSLSKFHELNERKFQLYCEQHNLIYFPSYYV